MMRIFLNTCKFSRTGPSRIAVLLLLALFFAALSLPASAMHTPGWSYWLSGYDGQWASYLYDKDNPFPLPHKNGWLNAWQDGLVGPYDGQVGPNVDFEYIEGSCIANYAEFVRYVTIKNKTWYPSRWDVTLVDNIQARAMLIDNGLHRGENWLFISDPFLQPYNFGITINGQCTTCYDTSSYLDVFGSDASSRYVTTFRGVDITKLYHLLIKDYDTVKFEGGSLNVRTIDLYDNATLIWDADMVSGTNPHLQATSIYGNSNNTVLNLRGLRGGSLDIGEIAGVNGHSLTVSLEGDGRQTIGSIRNAKLSVLGGDLMLGNTVITNSYLHINKGAGLSLGSSSATSLYELVLEGALSAGGALVTDTLSGAGTIRVNNTLSLKVPSSTFTGAIDLNGGTLSADSYQALGRPGRIINSNALSHGTLSIKDSGSQDAVRFSATVASNVSHNAGSLYQQYGRI